MGNPILIGLHIPKADGFVVIRQLEPVYAWPLPRAEAAATSPAGRQGGLA
jgi:hypothetical protein